jgi:hypothetical protein
MPALAADKTPAGKGPCKAAEACQGGVCIEVNGRSYCSQTCELACPAGMYCDDKLFEVLSLKVCAKGSEAAPVKPEQGPAKLPCQIDRECPGGLVCAEAMGVKDCTIECRGSDQCRIPELMGVKMDFLTCAPDEANRARTACLPKRECLANPMSCISVEPRVSLNAFGGLAGMTEPVTEPESTERPTAAVPTAPRSAAARVPMAKARFDALITQLKKEAFADERTSVLSLAVQDNFFTCEQVGRVIDQFAMGDEKVAALQLAVSRLVDRANSHTILARFTFSDDKEAAKQILARTEH